MKGTFVHKQVKILFEIMLTIPKNIVISEFWEQIKACPTMAETHQQFVYAYTKWLLNVKEKIIPPSWDLGWDSQKHIHVKIILSATCVCLKEPFFSHLLVIFCNYASGKPYSQEAELRNYLSRSRECHT